MAFTLVQTPATFANSSSGTTIGQAFGSNNTAGNLLVAFCYIGGAGGGTPVSVTDTLGNTWFQAGGTDINISTIYYCPNCRAGANTVTFTISNTTTRSISVAEYSGQLAAHPVSTAVTPNGTFQPSAAISTPTAGSLILWMLGTNGSPVTWATFAGCTLESTAVSNCAWADNTSSSAGSNAVTAQMGAAPDFISKIVSFLPASYSPPGTPALVRPTEGSVATSGGMKSYTTTSPATDIFAGGNQSGNVIIVPIIQNGQVDFITGVTDTAGNTYTKQAGFRQIADSNNHLFYEFWSAPVYASSFANNTVTVAFSGSNGCQMAAIEVSGVSGIQDTNAPGNGSYTITAAAANELLVTMNSNSAGGTNYTGLSGTDIFGTTGVTLEVNIFNSASGSNSITSTISAGFPGSMTIAIKTGSLPPQNLVNWMSRDRRFINKRG